MHGMIPILFLLKDIFVYIRYLHGHFGYETNLRRISHAGMCSEYRYAKEWIHHGFIFCLGIKLFLSRIG